MTAALAMTLLSACSGGVEVTPDPTEPSAQARSVVLEGDGCGLANDWVGSGVLVDDGLVLTAGHVVAGSDNIVVRTSRGSADLSGQVVALDTAADLALVEIPAGLQPVPELHVGRAEPGDAVTIVGSATSSTVQATVMERSLLQTAEVRGTAKVERIGYRLDVGTQRGDSGAGVYRSAGQDDSPMLVALVYAASNDRVGTSWAVSGSEIQQFMTAWDATGPGSFQCDPEASQLVEAGNRR